MTLTAADLAVPLARYARRLHATAGARHHVASPLGAWLLLALCAPASTGETRDSLNAIVGCAADNAADLAAGLLARPHPAVPAAAAAWYRALTEAQSRWVDGLPPEVETGPLPGQAELDDWVRRHTSGLIGRFPARVDESVDLVLASVLATRVSWERPFDLAPASALGPGSPWTLTRVLRTPDGPGHEQFVAATEAGDVAVHAARAREGLLVVSVAAAPDVAATDVIAVAYDLATALGSGRPVTRRSLFDLPLGEAPLWTVTEQSAAIPTAREERCTAVLPAWSADSEHDLGHPGLGFGLAAHALAPGGPWAARQAAAARYDRVGFEAAAVSALAVAMSMRAPRRGLLRTAELRFGHPYAVVAVAGPGPTGPGLTGPERTSRGRARSPWDGLPVFSAWVAEPQDAA